MTTTGNQQGASLKKRLIALIETMSESELRQLVSCIDEKRQHPRKPYIMSVRYHVNNRQYEDFILDLSLGGTFIETSESFQLGQRLSLIFSFRNLQNPFLVDGEIVWQARHGIGVKFCEVNEQQREILQSFLESI